MFTNLYDRSGRVLPITRNFTMGGYQVTLTPTSGINDTANIAYYATPPELTNPNDIVLLDGDTILYGALTQHFFTNRLWTEISETRNEYENRVEELQKNPDIPAPGDLLQDRFTLSE